jgi:cation:H+ antiporter
MANLLNFLMLALGFGALIKGADFLVEGASSLARRLRVSDLAIGLTVVAFGTSTPELFVNLFASFKGSTDIAIGNVLGSNIANILLILGVSSLIYPLAVSQGTVWKEIPLSLLAAVVLGVMVNDHWIDGASPSVLARADGLVLLSFFLIFLYYSYSIARDMAGLEEQLPARQHRVATSLLLIVLGLAGLGLGGKWIVDAAVQIATRLSVSEAVIGLTVVAVGTSLPELATSAVAAYRHNVDIAVGNVVGSNIFNIFFVLGLSATIRPLPFDMRSNLHIGVVVLASLMLFGGMFSGRKRCLDRWEGGVFLVLYIGYVLYLILHV